MEEQTRGQTKISDLIARHYPHQILHLPLSARLETDGDTQYMNIDDNYAIVRSDGKVFGTCGSKAEIVQPQVSFNFFEPFEESGLIDVDQVTVLRGGKTLCVQGSIKKGLADIVPGDTIKARLLAYTSFDGVLPQGFKDVNQRVVCANTLRMAIKEGIGAHWFKFKHTKSVHEKIENAQQTIAISLAQFQHTVETFKYLASKPCNDRQLETYIRDVFETPIDPENSSRSENMIQELIEITLTQPEKEMLPVNRGTMWNAYNGVTRYLTHNYGRNEDTRTNSILFGKNDNVSKRALDLAIAH